MLSFSFQVRFICDGLFSAQKIYPTYIKHFIIASNKEEIDSMTFGPLHLILDYDRDAATFTKKKRVSDALLQTAETTLQHSGMGTQYIQRLVLSEY